MYGPRYRAVRESVLRFVDPAAFNIPRLAGMMMPPMYQPAPRRLMNRMRAGYWSSKVKRMGKGVHIDSGFMLRGAAPLLEIGDHSYIDTDVHFEMSAPIRIGKYVHVSPNVYIQSGAEVVIGDYAGLSNGCVVYSASGTYKTPDGRENTVLLSLSAIAPQEMRYDTKGPVFIEEFAFLGIGVIVLPNVRIGRGAIVGAGAVVTRDVPAYSIAAGVPARVIGERPVPPGEKARQ